MPAKPSSWAWKLVFSRRRANGERSSISLHQRTVSSSSAASGTTVLTSPISSASLAEYNLQRNHISFAFFGPTRLVRTDAPNPPSKLPTFGPTCPNFALSAAMVRSQTTCRTWPPPTAYPATIATTDLDVQIRDVEAPDRLSSRGATGRVRIFEVSGVSSYLLVPARAEGVRSFPRQDDDPCLVVFAGV